MQYGAHATLTLSCCIWNVQGRKWLCFRHGFLACSCLFLPTAAYPAPLRRLNLTCCLVATAAAAGDGGSTSRQLVPLLLSLDLLPLLASVLHGWVVRLRAEHQQFGGGSTEAEPSAEGAQESAGAADLATGAPAAAEAGGEEDPPSAVIAPPAPDSPAQWEEKAVAAAEVTQEAAMQALGLLEALQASKAGVAWSVTKCPVARRVRIDAEAAAGLAGTLLCRTKHLLVHTLRRRIPRAMRPSMHQVGACGWRVPSWLWAEPWHNVWRALVTFHVVPP